MKEGYIVEKKINIQIISIISVFILVAFGLLFAYFISDIQKHKIKALEQYISEEDFENASFVFNKLYEDEPLNKAVLFTGVKLYLMKMLSESTIKREESAEYLIRYAKQLLRVSLSPKRNSYVYYALAVAYQNRGEGFYIDAYRAYGNAVSLGRKDIETRIRYGKVAYLIGDYKTAINTWEECTKENQNAVSKEICYLLGLAYEKSGNYSRAISYLRALNSEESQPLAFDINLSLGNLYRRQGLYAESEFFYKKASQIDDKNPEVYYNLGMLYKIVGRRKEAIKNFRLAWKSSKYEPALNELLRM